MDPKSTYDIILKSRHTSSCKAGEHWLPVSLTFILPRSSDILIIVQNYKGLVIQAAIVKRNSKTKIDKYVYFLFMSVCRIEMDSNNL